MSLRRWKSFFPAFAAIDTAIETATGARSRDKFRQLRSELVEMLCDAADDDADRVKGLCQLLDSAMAEALLTLHVVPVTTTTGVDKAVEGLLSHEDGKVRALARGILIKWAQGGVLDTTVLAAPPSTPRMRPLAQRPETAVLLADTPKISDEKMPPVVSNASGDRVRSGQTGDAKRKHPAGYYREADADDEKRQRKVPEKVEDRPRKMEPDIKSRSSWSRASSWRSRDTKSTSRASSWRYRDERCLSTSTRHSHRRV
jgi:hypothetical protein